MKWEYKVETFFHDSRAEIERGLCALGAEGWELVSVDPHYILKREMATAAVSVAAVPSRDEVPWSYDVPPVVEAKPVARVKKTRS